VRIAFIADDFLLDRDVLRPGGCSYYRCMLPMNTLRGHKVAFGPPAFTSEFGFGVRTSKTTAEFGFDVVVLKMMMDRWVPKHMQIARDLGQRLIVDVDDHYDGIHEDNIAAAHTDPNVNKIRNREHYRTVIQAADLLTVSTPFLEEYYSPLVGEVVMVRNGINPNQFPKRDVRNRKPVLGWAGAMQWRSNDADTAVPWLGEFLDEHDLMFHHAGHMEDAPVFAEKAGVDSDRMILSPMRPLHRYHEMLDFDIGLVLLSEIDFNRAKSNIKGLEYAASNIPFVAQGLPEYALLAEQGVGRVANTPEEWKLHLTELLDYKMRKREAAVQRNKVLEDYSINARAHKWVDVYSRFADTRTDILDMKVSYVKV
jgi:glycosyltransferase involved in cell wall biosynthesis